MVPVYSLSEDRSTLAPLSDAERADGRVVEGGRALRFADGRPDRANLVVTQSALGAAIERMRIGATRV